MRGLRVGTGPIAISLVLWFGGAWSLPTTGLQPPTSDLRPPSAGSAPITLTNIARDAGLDMTTVFGGRAKNTYLVETTGTGVAMLDYDGDGWLDLFFVNGSTLEGFPPGAEPTNHLYRNRGNRTFEDVTATAGLGASGWGQGACVGDYDNDGRADLFVTYWGQNRLYHNDGNGHFADVADAAGLRTPRRMWSTGCAFLDYDRDGRLDLFAGRYIDFDPATTPRPESGLCRYRGLSVACGPPGLPGGRNALYRNRGSGAFEDVSDRAGITHASGTYALGVSTIDFDDDGWVDLYVANDSSPSALYRKTGRWTSSRRTSPATPRPCTATPVTDSARIAPLPEASGSTHAGSGGARRSSTSTTTAGSISCWPTDTSTLRCAA